MADRVLSAPESHCDGNGGLPWKSASGASGFPERARWSLGHICKGFPRQEKKSSTSARRVYNNASRPAGASLAQLCMELRV